MGITLCLKKVILQMYDVVKGTKVKVSRLKVSDKPKALAGNNLKFGAKQEDFEGVVRHIRGNHPINPTSIRLWVEPVSGDTSSSAEDIEFCERCGCNEVGLVNPDHVTVIKEESNV